jgi:uncharacterized membrane protein
MGSDLKVLDRHFRHWREQGLLSAESEQALRRASGDLIGSSSGNGARTALAAVGAGLLLAGMILIFGQKWEALSGTAKLGAWAVFEIGFLAAAYQIRRAWPDRPGLAEVMGFVAGGWVLAGVILASQIYSLHSRLPNGAWLWLLLVLPLAWFGERRATSIVVFIALLSALALEVREADSLVKVARIDAPWIWIGIPLLALGLTSLLPGWASFLRDWTGLWTFATANLFLLILGVIHRLGRPELGGAWWLVGAGLLFALVWPERCLARSWDRWASRLILAFTFLPWVLLAVRYGDGVIDDIPAVALAWLAQFAIAILVIREGARHGSAAWVNLGYLALLAGVVTRYFDLFGEHLKGGAALVVTGALLLLILFGLEAARRRSLRRGGPSPLPPSGDGDRPPVAG